MNIKKGLLLILIVVIAVFGFIVYNNDEEQPKTFLDEEIQENTVKRLMANKSALSDDDVYETMIDSVLCSLYEIGYEPFLAYAIVNDELVPGVGYTDYTIFDDSEETIYSCGFYQIVVEDNEMCLTDELVENGIFIIPNDSNVKQAKYLMVYTCDLQPSSGIFVDYYFKHDCINKYTIKFTLTENQRKYWDEEIDLYDFNQGKYIFKADLEYNSISALNMYEDESKRYYAARDAYEKIVEIQNSNGLKEEETCLIIFSQDILNQCILEQQVETLNNVIIEQLKDVELSEGQYIMISNEGVDVKLTHQKEDELIKDRMTNGIIGAIGSALSIVGSVVCIVATCGTSTPVAVAVITISLSSMAAAYGTSNLIESGLDIYYAANQDYSTEAFNPLLSGFKAVFGDTKKTVIAYHAWGISCSILSQFSNAVGNAVGAAVASKTNIALAVTRSVIVSLAKTVITFGVTTVINNGVIKLVENITGDPYVAKMAGFVSAVTVGIIVGASLEKIDAKYNISYNRQAYQKYAIIKKTEKIINSIEKNGEIANGTAQQKGNYGEMKMDQQMAKSGFEKVSNRTVTSLDDGLETGIDGIYYHKETDTYVILDAKAGSAQLGNTANGKQMSKEWIFGSNRLKDSVSTDTYYDILSHWSDGKVITGVCRVNLESFTTSFYMLDDAANIQGSYSTALKLLGII